MSFINGDLRVWHIQNPPSAPAWYNVKGPQQGANLINELARRDLLPASGIESNAIGLCVYEDGDWVDWYDEDGDDLDTWAEKRLAIGCKPTERGGKQ